MERILQFLALLAGCLLAQAGSHGSLWFAETGPDTYLQQSNDELQFSEADVSASVSMLLGIDPPFTMAKTTASKIARILRPNPFHRPRRVALLVIEGFDQERLKEKNVSQVLGLPSGLKRSLALSAPQSIKKASKHLVGKNVRLESLNFPVDEEFKLEDLERVQHELGIYVEFPLKQLSEEEEVVFLSSGERRLQFDLSKRTDYKFVADLLSLSDGLRRAVASHTELSKDGNDAELFLGTISGLKAFSRLRSSEVAEAGELLLAALSKVAHSLQTASNGEIVFIAAFPSESGHQVLGEMIGKHYHASSSRYLLEEAKKPQTVQIVSRRTLAASTSIILIIAAILGVWCLCYMPFTRDSLLYAGPKLQ